MTKEISCRTTNAILQYLMERGDDVWSLVEGLEHDFSYLINPNNWVSHEFLITLYGRLEGLDDGAEIMFRIGLSTGRLGSLGTIHLTERILGNPRRVMERFPEINRYLSRICETRLVKIGSFSALLEVNYGDGVRVTPQDCDYYRGLLSSIPTIWRFDPASVRELQCAETARSSAPPAPLSVESGPCEDGASTQRKYLYQVRWNARPRPFLRVWDYFVTRPKLLEETVLALERDNRLIEQKYDEFLDLNDRLQQRNQRLRSLNEQLRDANDKIGASARDLAEWKKKLEEKVGIKTRQLREAQQKLVESEKFAAAGMVATNIVHEVSNPLSVIKTSLLLLSKSIDEEDKTGDTIRIINGEIDRIAKILAGLLNIYRPQKEPAVPISVDEILHESLLLLADQFRLNNIRVRKEIDVDTPKIMMSPDQMKQVLFNILSNAKDSMPGGGSLSVKTECLGGRLQVHVSDSGHGIPEGMRSKVLEPFFTTKKDRGGMGLGLSISYGILKEYDGEMEIKTEEGKGTTFTLSFPVHGGR